MKKSFLYSVMALFMCLFAACSQEEIVSDGELGSNKVSLSVKIPAMGPVSRAADLTVEGYTMRCIMELVDAEGNLIADTKQMSTSVTNGTASFEFTKPTGEYSCVFWAEYLNSEGKSFYKTSAGLKEVAYDGNKKNELFNNKAADAFCGKLASSMIASSPKITLKRPFTRIAISKTELDKLGKGLNQCTPSINGAQGYNVVTGKTIAAVTLTQTIDGTLSVPTASDDAFFCYVFPANSTVTKPTSISFTKDGDASTSKAISITADQMKEMKPNVAVNLVPTTGDDGKAKVDIVIDDTFENGGGTDPKPEEPGEGEDPENPATVAVGNYLYADGTWGTATANAIGVVFHVGKYEGDNGAYPMSTVKGYAVALKDAAAEGVKWADVTYAATTLTTVSQDLKSYDGYKNCQATEAVNGTAFNTLAPVKAALDYDVTLTAGKTSGWYLPTAKQLEEIRTNIDAINTAFTALGSEKANAFVANNYWSCIIATSGKVFRAHFDSEDTEYEGTGKASSANSAFYVRAILTF